MATRRGTGSTGLPYTSENIQFNFFYQHEQMWALRIYDTPVPA